MSYPAPVLAEARRLRSAGWKVPEIHRMLSSRGRCPSLTTLYIWTVPEYADRHRESTRRRAAARSAARSGGRVAVQSRSPEFRLARMRALREAGLSCQAIAHVVRLDFGMELSEAQVRSRVAS